MKGPDSIHTIQPVVNNANDQSKVRSYPPDTKVISVSINSAFKPPKIDVAIKPNVAVRREKPKPKYGEPRPRKPTAIIAARAKPFVMIEIRTKPRVVLNFAHSAAVLKSGLLVLESMHFASRLKSTHPVTPDT